MNKRAVNRSPVVVRGSIPSRRFAQRTAVAGLRSAAVLACLAMAGGPAVAQQLYFDTNGATTGSGNANGTWDESTTAVWSTSSAGTLATTTFGTGNASTAVFAAGTDFTTAGRVVTVSGTVAPAGILFESEVTSMSLTGGTIAFNNVTGSINSSALGTGTGKQVTIATPLTGTAGVTINANGSLAANGGSSNAYFELSGDNTGLTGGIAITGGLVSFPNNNAAGGNTITLSNFGGILDRNINLQLASNIVVQSTGGTFRLYGTNLTTNFSGSITGTGAINRTDGGTLTLSGSGAAYTGTYNNQAGTTVFTATDWGSAKFNLSAGALSYTPATAGAVVSVNDLTAVGSVNILNDGVLDVTTGAVKLRSTGTVAVAKGTGAGVITSSSGTLTITSVDANGVTTTGTLGTSIHTFSAFVANAGAGGATPVAVVKNGVNDVAFSAANTYSGGTTVNAGRLTASNAAGFGTGAVAVNNGGQAFLSTGTGTYGNAFTIAGLGQLEAGGTFGAVRLSGGANIAGLVTLAADSRINAHASTGILSGGIAQAGGARSLEFGGSSSASTITLTAAAGYTGATTISNATVNVGTTAAPAASNLLGSTSGIALGAFGGAGSGTLNLNVAASYTYDRPTTFGTAGSTLAFFTPNATDVVTVATPLGTTTANGVLSMTGGQLRFPTGTSAQNTTTVVTAAPANSATAAIGTLTIEAGASLATQFLNVGVGANTSGIVNQTGGTVTLVAGNNSGGLRVGHWANGSTLGSQYNLTGGTLDGTGLSANTTASAQVVNVGWDGLAQMTVGGGAGAATLKAYGVQIDGNTDTTTANDTLTVAPNGTVEIGAGGIAGATANDKLILLGGATLRGTASGTWSVATDTTAGGTTTLDVASGATVTFTAATTGTGTFAKTGGGTLQVQTAIGAGGGVAVNAGTLTGTANVGDLTVAAGGTLRPGANANEGTVGTMNAASLAFNGGIARFDLSGSAVTVGGTTNDLIAVVGTGTFAGGTIQPVFNGPVTAGNVYTLVTTGGVPTGTLPTVDPAVTGNSRLAYAIGTSGNNVTLTVTGAAKALKWTGGTDATWNTNASQNWQDAAPNDQKFMIADTVTFDSAGAAFPTVTLSGSLSPGSTTVNATTDYTFAGTGSIAGGSLSKTGTGTLTILTNNSYTGTTTVTAGRVVVGNGGTSGSLGTGTVALSAGTKLAFNRSDTATAANVISGAGAVEVVGTGVALLSGASTFTGGTLVSKGTLQLGAAAAAGTGAITVGDANTGAADVAVLSSRDAGTTIANAVTVANLGTGLVTIGSNGGSVSGGTIYSGVLTLNRPVTLQSQNTDKTLFSGRITGPVGTLTVTGGRRTTIRATTNDFVGNVSIVGTGTILQASEGGAAETVPNASSVDVGAGAAFQLAGALGTTETIAGLTGTGTVQRNVSGTQTLAVGSGDVSSTFAGAVTNGTTTGAVVAIGKIGTGTLTLNGANTYTGGTTVAAGTLLADTPGTTNSATGAGAVGVSGAGRLGGSGRIAGAVLVDLGGKLAPGAVPTLAGPVGTLSVANTVTLGTAGAGNVPTLEIKVRDAAGSSDVLALTGATTAGVLTLSNPDVLNIVPVQTIKTARAYTIATFASVAGTFDTVLIDGQPSQSTSSTSPNYALVTYGTTNITLTVNNVVGVPEPATAGLLGIVATGLLARRRRRR